MEDAGPPTKKNKVTIECFETLDTYINLVNKNKNNLVPILSDEIELPLPLVKVYVGCITNVKQTSYIIQVLNEKFPLKELQHLKRVRHMKVILCESILLDGTLSIQEFLEINLPELKHSFTYFEEISVPAQTPKTQKQFKDVSKLWSCNFHPNSYIEKLLNGNFFPANQLSYHMTNMKIVMFIAKWFIQNYNLQNEMEDIFKNFNAAVVVDPLIKSIVAISFDNTRYHPIQHATMLAIDNVAKTQKGGAWNNLEDENDAIPGCSKELLSQISKEFPKVYVGARNYISKNESMDKDSGPYLCTGYDIYILKEPCLMCSMALTHARVKRVFFALDNSECGGLKSRTKLHTEPSLNHHYEVFTGFLPFKPEILVDCEP